MEEDKSQLPSHPPKDSAAAQALRVLAKQSQKTSEHAATLGAKGILILQELRCLRTEIKNGFERLEKRSRTERLNRRARLGNRFLGQNDKLAPLLSYKDNNDIAGFPATPGDIDDMSIEAISAILEALEEPAVGHINERREQLKRAVGLH